MIAQPIDDIHHYGRRLAAALSILPGDKRILEKNRKNIKQFLEYIRAEGLSIPRQVRYVYVLRKISNLLGKEFYRTTKPDMITIVSEHRLRIKTCLRCQESNSPTNSFCSRCRPPLDMRTAMQLHEEESKTHSVMDDLLEDPEVKEVLLSKLKAMAR